MSIVSGTVGAILGSNAQNKATKTNLRIAQETNELNRQMFLQSRGEGGSAILPTYLAPGTEEAIANKAAAAVQAMFPNDPQAQMAHYQAIIESLTPTINAGTAQIDDIYNGKLDAERQAALAPVLAARTQAANANAEAINEAGQEQMNQIGARDAARGYSGGGSFADNNVLRALVQARQAAAAQRAAAVLGNAGDQRQLADFLSQLRLQSVDAPINRAKQLTQLAQMPQMALGDLTQAATRPLEFFRIGNQAFQYQRPGEVSAVPGAAQLALQGISQTGGSLMNAYLKSNPNLMKTNQNTFGGAAKMDANGLFQGSEGYGQAAGAASAAGSGAASEIGSEGVNWGAMFSGND